jgi:SAM-dependent methyltransferase
VPFHDGDLRYDDVQRRHYGYALHAADNAYVKAMLRSQPGSPSGARRAARYLAEKTADRRYAHALEVAVAAADRGVPLRVLEVGCNLGYIGGVLVGLGHAYVGIDVQRETIDAAVASYGPHFRAARLQDVGHTEAGRQDLVLAFDVIEHVTQPRDLFRSCVELLRPGGRLMITTPDGDAMRRGQWSGDLPPLHMAIFGRRAFRLATSEYPDCAPIMWNEETAADPVTQLRANLSRLVRGESDAAPAAPPEVAPLADNYVYDARHQRWDMPIRRRSSGWAWRAASLARGLAAAIVGRTTERTLIVEIVRAR